MADSLLEGRISRTGGREATKGVIPGRAALSVGLPHLPAPHGWAWTALSEVAQLESGHTPSRKHPEYWGGGVPWIGIKDAVDNHGRTIMDTYQRISDAGLANSSTRLLPQDTVCLSRTASVGYVVKMGVPMATSQDFVNWVCGPSLRPDFLKYILLFERDSLLRFASGTTHQTIYYPEAKAFHALLPPVKEQQRILEVLCAIDDKVDLNRRTNETLEGIARGLFKSWFVDFDPVRAKCEGRPLHLDEGLGGLFPARFVAIEGERVPEGWSLVALDDLLELQRGFDLPASMRVPGPYPVVQASGPAAGHAEYKVKGPGVVTGRSGVLGRVFLIHEDFWPLNTTLWVKSFKLARVCFAYFQLSRVDFGQFNAGSAVPTLNRNHVHSLRVVAPPPALVDRFEEIAYPILRLVRQKEMESESLGSIRDTLLPKLLSGELRIRDAERVVGKAV